MSLTRLYATRKTADQSLLALMCTGCFEKDRMTANRAFCARDSKADSPCRKWFFCTGKTCHLNGKTERRGAGKRVRENNHIKQREAAHEGRKEAQTKESVWVRSHPPTAFFKAPKRVASILYYPSASLPSWRIFHLILVVTIENWTCRCVLFPLLLSRILFCSASSLWERQPRPFEAQGWHPFKVTDFTFTGKDGHQEDVSSSQIESDSGNTTNRRVPTTTQSSRGR